MSGNFTKTKNRLRAAALAEGVPSAEAERWLEFGRPCAVLGPKEDGPLAARLGGRPMLPVSGSGPVPEAPFIASLDLAAVPSEATDLPLPSDGRLLFFADPAIGDAQGGVVYVPDGAAVAERAEEEEDGGEEWTVPRGELRLTTAFSLPNRMGEPDGELLDAGLAHQELLNELWWNYDDEEEGPLQLGGYPWVWNHHPAAGEPADENWVLLAEWGTGELVPGLNLGMVHWIIPRADLAEWRFDRVRVKVDNV